MKRILVIFSLLLAATTFLLAANLDFIFSRYDDMKDEGSIACQLDTLLHLKYNDIKNRLRTPDTNFYFGPFRFHLDDSSLYFDDYGCFYKFNYHADSLVWRKEKKESLLNFRCYKGRLFFYYKDKIIIYNSDNMKLFKEISLKKLNVNVDGAANVGFFYDKYLFLFGYETHSLFTDNYLLYLYDMECDIFIDKRKEEIIHGYYPFTNCENCNYDFCVDLFEADKNVFIHGQSDTYILFYISCSKQRLNDCPEQDFFRFALYNKLNNSIAVIENRIKISPDNNKKADIKKNKPYLLNYRINLHSIDTIHFINDTSFVYQSYGGNFYDLNDREVFYIKASFKSWK